MVGIPGEDDAAELRKFRRDGGGEFERRFRRRRARFPAADSRTTTLRSLMTWPESADSSPRMMEKSVDFPAPFGPTSPMRSSRFTCRVTSSNNTLPPYALLISESVNIRINRLP